MFKYFALWATQKLQTSRCEYVYFQIYKLYQILLFCVAQNTKNLVIKFCILISYIIAYVKIYFQNFLKLTNIILIFF
jgi:hypothetical protein